MNTTLETLSRPLPVAAQRRGVSCSVSTAEGAGPGRGTCSSSRTQRWPRCASCRTHSPSDCPRVCGTLTPQ